MTIILRDLENVNLTRSDAMALAQLVKRFCWAELRACAVSDDEAYEMKYAVHKLKLQDALANVGYAPR